MALTERDVNTQRDVPRNKRHSIQADLSYTRLRDENSPISKGKTSKITPPSQRILAQTKASAAKVAATPRATGPSPSTSGSKLPRRSNTPKWSTRVAERVASAEKAAIEATDLQKRRTDASINRHLDEDTDSSSAGRCDAVQEKYLPAEKPLPSRPIASFVYELSPTKDSRTLVDAHDQPLILRVGDMEHPWPALTPHAERATGVQIPQNRACKSQYPHDEETASRTKFMRQITPNQSDQDHQADQSHDRSSSSTFFSGTAAQEAAKVLQTHRRQISRSVDLHHSSNGSIFPARKASLLYQPSNEDMSIHATGFSHIPRVATPDSRPHSPSPASFSRPRPGSFSLGRGLLSPTTMTPTAAKAARAQKTASRIPIPDSKKAMLVDVKSRCSSNASSKPDQCPSFGSRRLDAPDTLKILDQGIRRRQLRRTDTTGTTTTASSTTKAFGSSDTPLFDRSSTSTPDHTSGTSSEDEEEVVTPTFKPGGLMRSGSTANLAEATNSYYHGNALKLFDSAVAALGNMPPPTSPYTAPLPTIPSQAMLPQFSDTDVPRMPHHVRSTSGFDDMNKRLSKMHSAHAEHTAAHIGEHAAVPESTRFSLMQLLNEYAVEDQCLQSEGASGLDEDAKKHITRTLSVLEGGGSPPKTEVDNETLLQMFGHLKRGLEKPAKTTSFVDNAATAEKFLAQADEPCNVQENEQDGQRRERRDEATAVQSDEKPQLPPIEPVASKWSDSTSSLMPPAPMESISPRTTMFSSIEKTVPAPDPPRSIGYPSRIPSKANALIGPSTSSTPSPTQHLRRMSSATLSQRTPGSVKAARETLQQVRGGFARTTASAESKKSSKMPTPNTRPLHVADKQQRGRVASAEKARSRSDARDNGKTPRARSKSRFVLDKIGGLFSAKASKRLSAMPPLPATAETGEHDFDAKVDESPLLRTARTPPVTKMPTLSTPEHNALRSASNAGTSASNDTPIDTVAESDDAVSNQSLQKWSATLIRKAAKETNVARKERLLSFAKVLNDSLISAREAQISAETAQHAAKSAQLSFEMTQKSVAMLQRLAASMASPSRQR